MTLVDRPAEPDVLLTHPAVVRVAEAIAAHLVSTTLVVLETDARTAAQAADQLGVSVAQIANSLVFTTRADDLDPSPVPSSAHLLLVLTSGAHRVDTAKLAATLDLARVERADPELVRATTGFAIGGVAPVGHLHPVRAVVDVSLARHETVWAAAGHPRVVFRTTYDELIRLSGGTPAEVA